MVIGGGGREAGIGAGLGWGHGISTSTLLFSVVDPLEADCQGSRLKLPCLERRQSVRKVRSAARLVGTKLGLQGLRGRRTRFQLSVASSVVMNVKGT